MTKDDNQIKKGFFVFIDFRNSKTWTPKNKVKNIKIFYKKISKFFYDEKSKENQKERNHPNFNFWKLSFIGDGIFISFTTRVKGKEFKNIATLFIELLFDIDTIINKIEQETKEKLGVGISYDNKAHIINNDKATNIVSHLIDYASVASSLGAKKYRKHRSYRYCIKIKDYNNETIKLNNNLKEEIEDDSRIESKFSSSEKNFYFEVKQKIIDWNFINF